MSEPIQPWPIVRRGARDHPVRTLQHLLLVKMVVLPERPQESTGGDHHRDDGVPEEGALLTARASIQRVHHLAAPSTHPRDRR